MLSDQNRPINVKVRIGVTRFKLYAAGKSLERLYYSGTIELDLVRHCGSVKWAFIYFTQILTLHNRDYFFKQTRRDERRALDAAVANSLRGSSPMPEAILALHRAIMAHPTQIIDDISPLVAKNAFDIPVSGLVKR